MNVTISIECQTEDELLQVSALARAIEKVRGERTDLAMKSWRETHPDIVKLIEGEPRVIKPVSSSKTSLKRPVGAVGKRRRPAEEV